jgi:prepilin-type processing-associated H-X9-DG protein
MRGRGFTLLNLLVVIAIIALLLAVLMPTLRYAKEQSQSLVCRHQLKQWGLIFSMYFANNNDRFMSGVSTKDGGWDQWFDVLSEEYNRCGTGSEIDFWNCPLVKTSDYTVPIERRGWLMDNINRPEIERASYGINGWLYDVDDNFLRTSGERLGGTSVLHANYFWRTSTSHQNPHSVPLLGDSFWIDGWPQHNNLPPMEPTEIEYQRLYLGHHMSRFCINRHRGKINIVFADLAVQTVKLPALWELQWHKHYPVDSAYPFVWPKWLRKLGAE